MPENSLLGRWDISWIHSGEDFTGKKRIAFLSSPLYKYIQDQQFSIEIEACVSGLEESIVFRFLSDDNCRDELVYPLGTFIHKTADNGSVQVIILQNSDEVFHQLSVLRIGPQLNQRSCEHYFLDNDGNLRVSIMATDMRGNVMSVKRMFSRNIATEIHSDLPPLRKLTKTLGWDSLKFWPGMVLELCSVKCIRVARTAIPSLEMESLWFVDQSVDAIRKINFDQRDSNFRIDYSLQVTIGTKSWVTTAGQLDLVALNDLVRLQNSVPSAVDAVFKKISPQQHWKNYVEVHRHVLMVDNVFRVFVQNWNDLAQNAVDAICGFLEIPQNIDEEQKKFIELAIELEAPAETASASANELSSRSPSYNRLKSFTSFRVDLKSESISRYPSALNVAEIPQKTTSRALRIQSVPSEDFAGDATITAFGSVDVFGDMVQQHGKLKPLQPASPLHETSSTAASSFFPEANDSPVRQADGDSVRKDDDDGLEVSSASSVNSENSSSSIHHVDERTVAALPKPVPSGRHAIQEIAHRSSIHFHGGRGMRASLTRHDSPLSMLKKSTNVPHAHSSDEIRRSHSRSDSGDLRTLVLTDQMSQYVSGERRDSFSSHVEEGEYAAYQLLSEKFENLQYSDIYQDGTTVLKYLPVDMVNAPKVKSSIARGLLADKLGKGMVVIKHGRQGKPKRKILKCDPTVSVLLWYPDTANIRCDEIPEGKGVKIADILDIRLGTEVDPAAIDTQLPATPNAKSSAGGLGAKLLQKTSTALTSFFSKPETLTSSDSMYGTPVLRRNCTSEELALSFSFVLRERTLDIQCLSKEDFLFLTVNFKEIIKPQLTPILRTASNPNMDAAFEENPLKRMLKPTTGIAQSIQHPSPPNHMESKKSVRFIPSFDEKDDGSGQAIRKTKTFDGLDGDAEYVHAFDVSDLEPDFKREVVVEDPDAQLIESLRMSSTEALQIGLILTDQERKYGVNMYQSISPKDKSKIEAYVARGFTVEEAILRIFEKKHVPPHLQTQVGPSILEFESVDFGDEEKEADKGSKMNLVGKKKSSFLRNLFDEIDDRRDQHSTVDGSWGALSSRLRSTNALQIGLQLSQQEAAFGTNMYESLRRSDAKELRALMEQGIPVDDAVATIFRRRYEQTVQDAPVHPLIASPTAATAQVSDTLVSHQAPVDSPPPLSVDIGPSSPSARADTKDHTNAHPQDANDEKDNNSPVTARTGSSFFPNTASVLPSSSPLGTMPPPRSIPRMNSSEAVQMAMMLSEQEEKYGVNMFDSLRPSDEPEIERLVTIGYTLEQAVYALFEQNYMIAKTDSNGLDQDSPDQPSASAAVRVDTAVMAESAAYEEYEDSDEDEVTVTSQAHSVHSLQQPVMYAPSSPMGAVPPPMQALPHMVPPGYPPQMMHGAYPYPQQQFYGAYPGYPQQQQQQQQQQMMYQQYALQQQQQQQLQQQQQMYMSQAYYQGHPGYNYPGMAPTMPMAGYYPPTAQGYPPAAQGYYPQMVPQQSYSAPAPPPVPYVAATSSSSSVVSSGSVVGATEKSKPVARKSSIFGGSKKEKSRYKESDVKTIVNMGFNRDQAVNALLQYDNDLLRAIDSLTR